MRHKTEDNRTDADISDDSNLWDEFFEARAIECDAVDAYKKDDCRLSETDLDGGTNLCNETSLSPRSCESFFVSELGRHKHFFVPFDVFSDKCFFGDRRGWSRQWPVSVFPWLEGQESHSTRPVGTANAVECTRPE